jgi:hypothetical protein
MTVEVMRNVSLVACVATLSLLSTAMAYAAGNVAALKWDGSFCAARCSARLLAHGQPAQLAQLQLQMRSSWNDF